MHISRKGSIPPVQPPPPTPRGVNLTAEAPDLLRPEFTNVKLHSLPIEGPVADFGRHRMLPSNPDDLSQVMRFCIRHKEDGSAVRLVTALFEQGPNRDLTLCLGYPEQGDEQGPLTDKDLKLLLRWIDRWVPTLPGGPITVDLSGNPITPRGVLRLGDCVRRNQRVQTLDLSRTQLFNQPAVRKSKTLQKSRTIGRSLRKTLPSPRGERTPLKKAPTAAEAISGLLASSHLRGFWLNGNPCSREDRNLIIEAVGACSTLCALGMADCALSADDITKLVEMDSRKGWLHLSMGTKLTPAIVDTIATRLLRGNKTLITLDLGTTEPYLSSTVTSLFLELNESHCLQVLSLAGHSVWGDWRTVTEGLRRNTCLRTLDMSRCKMPKEFLDALVNALKPDATSPPNRTLTRLILPAVDDQAGDRDEMRARSLACSFVIKRNVLEQQLRDRARDALLAGILSAYAPLDEHLQKLGSQIVNQMDERDLQNLAAAVHKRPRIPTDSTWPTRWCPA